MDPIIAPNFDSIMAPSMDEPEFKAIYFDNDELLPLDVQNEFNINTAEAMDRNLDGTDFEHLVGIPTAMHNLRFIPKSLRPEHIEIRMNPRAAGRGIRAGATLSHLTETVLDVMDQLSAITIFKIGYASNPMWRYSNYLEEGMGWTRMILLDGGYNLAAIQLMEAHAISVFNQCPTCQNRVSGGEGPPNRSSEQRFYWVYMMVGDGVGPYGRVQGSSTKRRRVA